MHSGTHPALDCARNAAAFVAHGLQIVPATTTAV
jgi:hypothetical protein